MILTDLLTALPEGRLVSDSAFAAAYDAVPPDFRGGLKTAIARAHALFPFETVRTEVRTRHWEQGFTSSEGLRPADWALICLDDTFASIPRLLAAVLPALLAGIPEVAVLRISKKADSTVQTPWPQGMLAALELSGQEWAADVSFAELHAWLDQLAPQGRGRCLFFGKSLEASLLCAARLDIPARLFTKKPPDAIICPPEEVESHREKAPLVLSPEHAWFWQFSDLHPDWFFERSLALFEDTE